MNILKIDLLIDEIIGDYYAYLHNNKNNKNKTENKYIIQINKKEIEDNELYEIIYNIIERYILIFDILYTGFEYNEDEMKKRVLEKSKNPDINSFIFKYHDMIKNNIENIVDEKIKKELEKIKKTNINDYRYNLIKILIIKKLYQQEDKKKIYNKLLFYKTDEYKIITIVKKKISPINLNDIVLINIEHKRDAYMVYNMYVNIEKQIIQHDDIYEKIIKLINLGILIPIVDNILLYNKDNEKYIFEDNNSEMNKIKYIIEKIELATKLYDKNTNNEKSMKVFNKVLEDRKVVNINQIENINILWKLNKQLLSNAQMMDLYNLLKSYTLYPYVNFTSFQKEGFEIVLTKTTNYIRYTSIKNNKKELEYSTQSIHDKLHIMGFVLPANTISRIKDIEKIEQCKNKNGAEFILNVIKNIKMNLNTNNTSYYWLFNTEFDEIYNKEYTLTNDTSANKIENILSIMYEQIEELVYNIIIEEFNKYEQITYDKGMKLYDDINKMLLNNELIIMNKYNSRIIYYLLNRVNYDKTKIRKNEYNRMEYLEFKKINKEDMKIYRKNILNISNEIIKQNKNINNNIVGICQHNITLHDILQKQFTNPIAYQNEMMNFFIQYVIEDTLGTYICTSCRYQLNIQKYLQDGEFDNQTKKFIPYAIKLDVPLESLSEYNKYKNLIKSYDKIVERIGKILNVQTLSQNTYVGRNARKGIIKNTIDMLLIYKNVIDPFINEHKDNARKIYNIKDSKIYTFYLDDNIFVYISNDIDKFKKEKQRNSTMMLLFMSIFTLSENQLEYIGIDKKGNCNIINFDKHYKEIFKNIKIIINNEGQSDYIINYKILCYIIYIYACITVKNGLWEVPMDMNKSTTEQQLYLQLTFIHTIIDLFNSILEVKKDENIFKIFQYRIYNKLNNIFSNNILYDYLYSKSIENTKNVNKSIIKPTYKELLDYKNISFKINKWKACQPIYYSMKLTNKWSMTITEITNITNCEDGKFHNWKGIKCEHCKKLLYEIKYDKKISEEIKQKYIKNNKTVPREQKNIMIDENINKKKENKEIENDVNINNKINELINMIEQSNINIIIKNNIYKVNHNYLGIIIKDKIISNLKFTENNVHFKTDTLSYVENKIEIFYDNDTLILLGYNDGRQYIHTKQQNRYLMVEYSTKNKLMMMGYSKMIYKLSVVNDILIKENNDDKIKILDKILMERNTNIDNIRYLFITLINRIINNITITENEDDNLNKNIIELYNKYNMKMNNVLYEINENKNKIIENKYPEKIKDKMTIKELNNIDKNGNMKWNNMIELLLEIIKSNNKNKILISFINDYLNMMFNKYFYDMNDNKIEILNQFTISSYSTGKEEDIQNTNEQINEEEENQILDAKEEEEALDIENDEDDWNDNDPE